MKRSYSMAKRKQAEHGTRAKYVSGCHCEPCVLANRIYQRNRRGSRPMEEYLISRAPRHGSQGRYQKGCKCADCRRANAKAHLEMVNRKRERRDKPPERVHGTANGYQYWCCRCRPCTDANTVANRPAQARYQEKKRRAS